MDCAEGDAVAATREVQAGVMLDLDANGQVIGIEVVNVRRRAMRDARRPLDLLDMG